MRLFLDANVLFLAGYSSDSPIHDLLALARAGRCELVASAYAVEEASRNLVAKGPENAIGALEQALTLMRSCCCATHCGACSDCRWPRHSQPPL
ncbi:MAG: hypothetical protein EPO25_03335 [Gammaproteobacteria bacterium]|nr:MAG: hypothetical protein EPO25_03335 [Gammaproteobacteria bacterium]